MITIVQRVLDDVRAHARDESPRECCGMLIGVDDRVCASVRAVNLAEGITRFEIDPRDHFRAIRDARVSGFEVIGFYHSHPRSPALPSATDRAESGYADALHLIAGVRDREVELRLFRIGTEVVVEVPFCVEATEGAPGQNS